MDSASTLLSSLVPERRRSSQNDWRMAGQRAAEELSLKFPNGSSVNPLISYITFSGLFSGGKCVKRNDLSQPAYYCEVIIYDLFRMIPPFHHSWRIGILLDINRPNQIEKITVEYKIDPAA